MEKEGCGAAEVVKFSILFLERARCLRDSITYVNAHATGPQPTQFECQTSAHAQRRASGLRDGAATVAQWRANSRAIAAA